MTVWSAESHSTPYPSISTPQSSSLEPVTMLGHMANKMKAADGHKAHQLSLKLDDYPRLYWRTQRNHDGP